MWVLAILSVIMALTIIWIIIELDILFDENDQLRRRVAALEGGDDRR